MAKKIPLTTAQALIKFLNQQYISIDGVETPFVEGIFHIFGHGNVLGIGEALQENPGHLKSFQGKNEQGMAHSAIGFAKQSLRKKIYAVTASSGPGSANLLTATATAFANNIPILLLPADTFASRQPDPVLQQMEQPLSAAITTNDAFRPISRYWDRVQRPEQLMSALIRGFEVLTNPESAGPVTISICQDTEGEVFDYPEEFFKKRVHYVDRRQPTERELNEAVALIQSSKHPVLLAGGGAKYSEAGEIIEKLASTHNIPVVETHAGKSIVTPDFPQAMGGAGVLGTAPANQVLMEADLVIGVGTRYSDFTTSSKTLFNFETTKFLNINVNRFQTTKFDGLQVVADAKATLTAISDTLSDYQTEFNDVLAQYKQNWQAERSRLRQTTFSRTDFEPEFPGHFSQDKLNTYADRLKTELTQTSALLTINELFDENAIVISSAGSLPGDMQRTWDAKGKNTFHLEYGYSCMGYEVAAALGTKLAEPEKESYAFVGDGSFLMMHTELVTALQYDKKINVLLFDNAGYGSINNLQMEHGLNSQGTELSNSQDQVMQIDYAKIAEAYGAVSYKVNNLEDLTAALLAAKEQTSSTLIEIKVLPKTMSNDAIGSWWRTGVSQLSTSPKVQAISDHEMAESKKAWLY
ncbi:3D-(3,5/4)-trihydroxycyclohexane-1,2-dione acylhydrolase (decyclizing) [Enterococcus sp. HY326]|uniref:3D-(3,5/4)-trihydroxycyclohexane-1,2-dione acylhydrolase (decyclizing) n=1 Tax=Enterococcus sp. HY326 TaxID=2971265 RepID=UPI0022404396|nr:3D-(3,5/4)-trihydroxycyclohexane-1,2-dione acylhydrolase (decyclizing) [Enterococcus sp. HY326]